jgi:hypothetical protein
MLDNHPIQCEAFALLELCFRIDMFLPVLHMILRLLNVIGIIIIIEILVFVLH